MNKTNNKNTNVRTNKRTNKRSSNVYYQPTTEEKQKLKAYKNESKSKL